MIFDSCILETQLFRERTGADIALRANLQRDAAGRKQVHKRGIERCSDAVPDALHMQEFDGLADFLGATDLSCMHQKMKAHVRRLLVDRAKFFRGYTHFVAANAERHNRFGLTALCRVHDFHGCFGAELARGIENPVYAKALLFEWLGGLQNGFEICLWLLFW